MNKFLTVTAAAAIALSAGASSAERGSDGTVRIIYWQAPSILNPFLSSGTKDLGASSLILEPLARFDDSGQLVPFLATEIPTLENGGFAADKMSITWTLRDDIVWSDGTPLTAEDVQFTAQYCMEPSGGCAYSINFADVKDVEIIDTHTVKVHFKAPTPFPYLPFVSVQSPIIQKAQFKDCVGAVASSCTDENFGPIGTGPFRITDFRPNDTAVYEANPNYREASKPAFAEFIIKGGGDAAGAGRAVMETGEFDYAWNLQLAPDVIADMAEGGKGVPISGFGTLVERLEMNMTNPDAALGEGQRSTAAHPHPFLTDPAVREALSMAIDREILVEIGYGDAGRPTCDLVPAPAVYAANNTSCMTQDIAGANKLLDDAGWKKGSDGVRAKDGVRLSILYQTSTNAVRQDFQAIIKEWWSMIGVETELRNISGSVFFGGDPSSPDTFQKFYSDVEMYANNFQGTDPQAYMGQYVCDKAPRPETQWQGENINRYCDAGYEALFAELAQEGDVQKRGEITIKLNNMLTVDSNVIIPLVHRGRVSAHSNTLGGVVLNTWDSELWNVADWYRIK